MGYLPKPLLNVGGRHIATECAVVTKLCSLWAYLWISLGVGWLDVHLVCLCCHTVTMLFHHILRKWLTDAWLGKVLGTAPPGQLMSDANLCLTFKAANMTLCVSYSTPWILGINTSKSQSNLLYEAYRLPACLSTHAHSVRNKDAPGLLIMLQNQPKALGKWLVEDG